MFTLAFEDIFQEENLKQAYKEINKNASGLDEVTLKEFNKNKNKNIKQLFTQLITNTYSPEPLKKIEIDKPSSNEKRPIAISALKDKIVQRALYDKLNPYFDETFSNASYAYRPDKSTIKALNRVTNYLNQKKLYIVKTDIDNFFETIDHDILLNILKKHIADKRIIKLISLFLYTGSFFNYTYNEHELGVHQGDILSPLLSNIYLDTMDKYLENKNIAFVRYADDFVMLFEKKLHAHKTLQKLKKFLKTLNLKLEEEKTYISHIADGFSFLGVKFVGRTRSVENERFQKMISKLYKLSKKKNSFQTYIQELNGLLFALENYYLKIIQHNSTQLNLLQDALIESVAQKVYLSKKNAVVKTKKEFRNFLEQIEWIILFDKNIKNIIELTIAKGVEKYLANKTYKDSKQKINKKRNIYAKKFALEQTLHINTPGLYLGISKNKFVIKEKAKVKHTFPINKIKRIILEGKGFSLSSNVIQTCAANDIIVDFIDHQAIPYASLLTYNAATTQNIINQAAILNTPKQLQIAKAFIKAKAKNQLNYLKYLNKYHKTLSNNIKTIQKQLPKINTATSKEELMGLEGSIASIYWDSIKLILEVPFPKRITHQAKDLVNASLNYAYAILYGEVQHSIIKAGLSLHISFLHALDKTKPTLSFDLIEEFRTFIVDRTIVAMLNKNEPLKLDKNALLTKESRQLIAKNIKEKLSSYTMWKKESRKIQNIIQTQAYHLADVINNKEKKYKPFIGKY